MCFISWSQALVTSYLKMNKLRERSFVCVALRELQNLHVNDHCSSTKASFCYVEKLLSVVVYVKVTDKSALGLRICNDLWWMYTQVLFVLWHFSFIFHLMSSIWTDTEGSDTAHIVWIFNFVQQFCGSVQCTCCFVSHEIQFKMPWAANMTSPKLHTIPFV